MLQKLEKIKYEIMLNMCILNAVFTKKNFFFFFNVYMYETHKKKEREREREKKTPAINLTFLISIITRQFRPLISNLNLHLKNSTCYKMFIFKTLILTSICLFFLILQFEMVL